MSSKASLNSAVKAMEKAAQRVNKAALAVAKKNESLEGGARKGKRKAKKTTKKNKK